MPDLFLRTTDKHGKSYCEFQWPLEVGATVTAPDWEPSTKCGNGLHGLLNGEGDSGLLSYDADALWWIVEAADAINLDGKHKFKACRVVAFGPREEITPQLRRMTGRAVHGLIEGCGYRSTLTGGDYSTLTGGYRSTLTGDCRSTLIFLNWRNGRRRVLTAYVGENGVKPNVPYRANGDFTGVVEVAQ